MVFDLSNRAKTPLLLLELPATERYFFGEDSSSLILTLYRSI